MISGEKELWAAVDALRSSQGFYGALAEPLESCRKDDFDVYAEFCGRFEGMDIVDVILELENW